MLLSSLLFIILMKFQSLVTVSYTNVTAPLSKALLSWYWYRAATVGGDTYIVEYCSSSPVGGNANTMTAWMTVTRTARTTWIVIGLINKSIFDYKQIFGGRCSTSWPALIDPLSPTSSPNQVVGPPGQHLTELSARWRSCRPRADGSTLIADTD